MEKSGDQSANRARLEQVAADGPLKHEIVPAEQGSTMQVCVYMDVTLLHCPICYLPFKPPVFQCNGGHLACGNCRGERPGNQRQCESCERGSGFNVRNTAMDAVVSSARVQCDHDGCGLYVTYHELRHHQSTCPLAPCKCPAPGCDIAAPPQALLGHLGAAHSLPVLRSPAPPPLLQLSSLLVLPVGCVLCVPLAPCMQFAGYRCAVHAAAVR